MKVAAIATRGSKSPLRSGPEEFIYDYEREPINNISINQEILKSLGVKHNVLLKTLFFTMILSLCVCKL